MSEAVKLNGKTMRAIKRVENGQDLIGPFDTVEEAMDYLNN